MQSKSLMLANCKCDIVVICKRREAEAFYYKNYKANHIIMGYNKTLPLDPKGYYSSLLIEGKGES